VYPVVPTFSFSLDSSSRGYYEYQSIWANPPVDDKLIYEREAMDSSVLMMDLTDHYSTDDQSPPKKKTKTIQKKTL